MRTFTTRDGSIWMPSYLTSIDSNTCIGCCRCFKVCSRDVMHLHGVDDAGEILAPAMTRTTISTASSIA